VLPVEDVQERARTGGRAQQRAETDARGILISFRNRPLASCGKVYTLLIEPQLISIVATSSPRTRLVIAHPPAARKAAGARRSAVMASESTSTQRIVDSIVTAIVERRLMPGTKLAEQKIADIFQVSRTIVRQALNRLSQDKLVTLEPARGARVAEPSVDEAHQVFEVRRILEASIVQRLAAVITPAQVAELRAHLADEQSALAQPDVSGRTQLLGDFHVIVARMLGNEVLTHLLADLLSRCSLISLMFQSSQSAECSFDEHVALVNALERRDGAAAAKLLEDHILHVEQNLQLDQRVPDLQSMLQPSPKR
jgi:DNA-binding GntR family transcriptional regulator